MVCKNILIQKIKAFIPLFELSTDCIFVETFQGVYFALFPIPYVPRYMQQART